jgi:hypothetical protein
MKARLDCIPCFLRQALQAARLSTDDPVVQAVVMEDVLDRLRGLSLDASPAVLSRPIYDAVRDTTGVADPFAAIKEETNRTAMAMLPDIRRRIAESGDPLHFAIKAALAGNIIDFGAMHSFHPERDVLAVLDSDLTVDHSRGFVEMLAPDTRLLYICDNAGEIAFDRLLIEQLSGLCKVTAAVKSGPIINDATMHDARAVGLTEIAPVIETGSDDVGVNWDRVSGEFRRAFETADMVLAKGQGNFESLNDRPEDIFFLLRVKCPQVGDEFGAEVGDTVFLQNRRRKGSRRNG